MVMEPMSHEDLPDSWDGDLYIELNVDEPLVVLADVDADPEEEFERFAHAQLEALHAWLSDLPSRVSADVLDDTAVQALAAFFYALGTFAERCGQEHWSVADLYCRIPCRFTIALELACNRVQEPDRDREAGRVVSEGLATEQEAEAEKRARQRLASRLRRNGRLGSQVAERLSRPIFSRRVDPPPARTSWRPVARAPRRGQHSRRQRPHARGACASRGDPSPGDSDDSDPEDRRLNGEVAP
jgi:hypothetical protein